MREVHNIMSGVETVGRAVVALELRGGDPCEGAPQETDEIP